MSAARCDNASVGVLIEDHAGRLLMFRRATFPVGIAPVAGHVDDHGGTEQAAYGEVSEELGLTVTALTYVTGGWRENRCRREPGAQGVGHFWNVYRANVTGDLNPDAREALDPAWYSPAEVQALTDRTVAYAHGKVGAAEFEADPGLEPVWVQWLAEVGVVSVSSTDLDAVFEVTR